jgi:hypothetical protein
MAAIDSPADTAMKLVQDAIGINSPADQIAGVLGAHA